MKKIQTLKIFAALMVTSAMTVSAQPETFAVNGVNYQVVSDSLVEVIKPTTGEYSGAFTLESSVTWQDKKYKVKSTDYYNVLQNSDISQFTLADGWQGEDRFRCSLRNVSKLERIDLKGGVHADGGAFFTINLGNNPGCVYASLTKGEDSTSIHLEKFNVYGPNGEKLIPYLRVEDNTHDRIYPDENMTFNLGKGFRTKDGRYCVVLEVSSYVVVGLNVDVNGYSVGLRIEPLPAQGSPAKDVDGIAVATWDDVAVITPNQNPATVKGEVSIPENVTIGGKQYSITGIYGDSFKDCPITSLKFPASIRRIYGDNTLLRGSETLQKVDLSAANNIWGSLRFEDCPNLKEAILPDDQTQNNVYFNNCTSLSTVKLSQKLEEINPSSFYNCSALSEISLPSTIKYIGGDAFYGCSFSSFVIPRYCNISCPFTIDNTEVSGAEKLYTVEVLQNTDDVLKVKVNANFYDTYNRRLPLCIVPDYGNYQVKAIVYADAENVFTINKKYSADGSERVAKYAYFCYDATKGSWLAGPAIGDRGYASSFCYYNFPSQTTDVDSVVSEDDNAPEEIYNLQGVMVGNSTDNLTSGIYIVRKGKTVKKIAVK